MSTIRQEVFVMTRKKGSKDYPKWMKRKAIKEYLEEGLPYPEITERYDIRDPRRVKTWVGQYRKEGEGMFANKRKRSGRKPNPENESDAQKIARLEMEVDLLKKFHSELRKMDLVERNIGQFTNTKKNTK